MGKNASLESIETLINKSRTGHTVLLTSFRHNGQGVDSPVDMIPADGKLYFLTSANTWKVRRIAHNPQVMLALCTIRGKILSPTVSGLARRLAGFEAKRAHDLMSVDVWNWLMNILHTVIYPGEKTAVYEITLNHVQPSPIALQTPVPGTEGFATT